MALTSMSNYSDGMFTPMRSRAAWGIVAGVALVQALAAGVGFYGSTIYVAALTAGEGSFSVVAVSIATGTFMLVSGLGGIVVARAMERSGPRLVIAIGAMVQAGALATLGRVSTDAGLLAAYGVMGIGFAALTVVPAARLVAAWFDEGRRAVAMSIAFMGLPIGGVLGTPAISRLVESVGFREATLWLAATLVAVVVPTSALLREPSRPLPEPSLPGTPLPAAAPVTLTDDTLTTRESWSADAAVRTRWFVLVTAALSLAMVSQVGALTHLYSAVAPVRSAAVAASTVSIVTLASLVGRVAGSWALHHFGLLRSTGALAAGQGLALIGVAAWRDDVALVAAAVLLGLTVGNLQVSQPLLLSDRFGPVEFPRILAIGNLFSTIGMSVGPLVVGVGVSFGWDYGPSFLVLAGCSIAAAGLLLAAGRTPLPSPVLKGSS